MNQSSGVVNVSFVGFVVFIVFVAILALVFFLCTSIVKRHKEAATAKITNISETSKVAVDQLKSGRSLPHIPTIDTPETSQLKSQPEYIKHVAQNRKDTKIDAVLTPSTAIRSNATDEPLKYIYTKREHIMTHTERVFYKRLFSIIGRQYLIFPQIHLSTLMRAHSYYRYHTGALATIQRKSVDYVLCDTNLKILCAIELDDSSHLQPDRIKRDQFVNKVFKLAGLPLIRISTHIKHSDQQLVSTIKSCIDSKSPDCVYEIYPGYSKA